MPWQEEAKCLGMDTDIFFPTKGEYDKQTEALNVCRDCPVRQECLNFAFTFPDEGGIWGGTTGRQRLRMRKGIESKVVKIMSNR